MMTLGQSGPGVQGIYKRQKGRGEPERGVVKITVEVGAMLRPQGIPRGTRAAQGEGGFPPEPMEGAGLLFEFRLLASRTVRAKILVILRPLTCSSLLQQPWETSTLAVLPFVFPSEDCRTPEHELHPRWLSSQPPLSCHGRQLRPGEKKERLLTMSLTKAS